MQRIARGARPRRGVSAGVSGQGTSDSVLCWFDTRQDPVGPTPIRELLTFLDFTSGNDLPEMIAKVALACVAGAAQAAVPSDKIASLPGWPQNEQVRLYRNPGCDAQPYHPGSSASPPTLPKTTVPFRPYCPVPTMYSGYLTSTTGSSRRSLTPRTCLWCTGPTADREARVSMPDCSPRVRIAPR